MEEEMDSNLDEMLKQAPTLTLNPFTQEENSMGTTQNAPAPEEPKAPEITLTPAEQKMVDDFAAQIDLNNTQMVMQYGAGSQKKIADFSENALSNVRTKDMGEIGQMLTSVVSELKDFNEEEEKGFL